MNLGMHFQQTKHYLGVSTPKRQPLTWISGWSISLSRSHNNLVVINGLSIKHLCSGDLTSGRVDVEEAPVFSVIGVGFQDAVFDLQVNKIRQINTGKFEKLKIDNFLKIRKLPQEPRTIEPILGLFELI